MAAGDAADRRRVCRAIQLALSDIAVFTHVTAAELRGWWLPDSMRQWPVIACTTRDAPHHNRRGVYIRRCALPAEHRDHLDGIRIASPEWTIIELAEDLSLLDLVVVIDSALHLGDCTIDSLSRAVVPRRRGASRLRRAIALADPRSASPWETVLRLVHVLSGITDVEPQAPITDRTGQIVARADLRLGRSRRIAEYDGGVHRGQGQHQDDLRREKRLLRLGMERYGYTAIEIHRQPHQIVRDAEDALGLEHDPRRVDGWLSVYASSSLTTRGRAALRGRMRRFERNTSPRARSAPSASSA